MEDNMKVHGDEVAGFRHICEAQEDIAILPKSEAIPTARLNATFLVVIQKAVTKHVETVKN